MLLFLNMAKVDTLQRTGHRLGWIVAERAQHFLILFPSTLAGR